MDDTQIYIGTPNGIVLCADSCSGHIFKGRFYHLYSKEPVVFNNQDQLIFGMEKFYDSILFLTRPIMSGHLQKQGRIIEIKTAAGTAERADSSG